MSPSSYSGERNFTSMEQFIDANVLDEARRRIRHLYEVFDTVAVSFSGGKDSLTVLHLVKEIHDELGIPGPVPAVFYDEELIPTPIIDFVDEYRRQPWLDLRWLAIPLKSTKYILGDVQPYTQWDPDREWVRPKPEWAITQHDLGMPADLKMSQFDMESIVAPLFTGSVCLANGIRAQESPTRRRSVLNNLHECYINETTSKKLKRAKPIYDWSEDDVFRYFYDAGIRYCPTYDGQMWAQRQLRVATPLLAENARYVASIREEDADFWDRLVAVFPDVATQARYHGQLTKADHGDKYSDGWPGIERWITEQLQDPAMRSLARKRLRTIRRLAELNPLGYQTSYVLRSFTNGGYKRVLQAEQRKAAVARLEREGGSIDGADLASLVASRDGAAAEHVEPEPGEPDGAETP